jgi:hypothetical protein
VEKRSCAVVHDIEHFSDFNASQTALRERKEYSATLAQSMACLITGSYKKVL